MSVSDRFVEFLRRAAAGYNAPPPTPSDEMWARIEDHIYVGASTDEAADRADERAVEDADWSAGAAGADSSASDRESRAREGSERDMDRFVEFLCEAAAGYNAPPPAPRDAMWDEIESTLALEGMDESLSAAAAYHAPPPPPREEMWRRIEAAWQMRRSAGPAARDAGLDPLPARRMGEAADATPAGPRRDRRRAIMVTGTGLAIAASLVIGIAIGRRSIEQLRSDSSPAVLAEGSVAPASTDQGSVRTPEELAGARDPAARGEPGTDAQGVGPAGAAGGRLETAPPPSTRLAAVEPQRLDEARPDAGRPDVVTGERMALPTPGPSRRDVAVHYATAEHLGRAEALLTTFRTDPEAANGEISRWASELLAETRLLMDLPGERDPETTALLQELELILALIAALGDDAPSVERAFVANGLDRQGTLPRLRAAMPSGPAGPAGNWRVGT